MFEIGSYIIASVIALAGLPAPDLVPPTAPPASCSVQSADTCLETDVCDVFTSPAGTESCALACDLRDVSSCASDGACEVRDGVCDYPASDPVGC